MKRRSRRSPFHTARAPASETVAAEGASTGATLEGAPLRHDRREGLRLGAGLALAAWVRPASADAAQLDVAIRAYTGGPLPRVGKVRLEIAPLVDNGNAVPLAVQVDAAPGERVVGLAVFSELNPQREVIAASFGESAGAARLATRIRLATSQKIVAVARLADGSHWSHSVDVLVTLAACIEG